jgi:hypothetical protein
MLNACKTKESQNRLQKLQWKQQREEECHAKDGETRVKGTNVMGIKTGRQCPGTVGMEEDGTESQDSQQAVALEKKKRKQE